MLRAKKNLVLCRDMPNGKKLYAHSIDGGLHWSEKGQSRRGELLVFDEATIFSAMLEIQRAEPNLALVYEILLPEDAQPRKSSSHVGAQTVPITSRPAALVKQSGT